jgi:hypothetical protein
MTRICRAWMMRTCSSAAEQTSSKRISYFHAHKHSCVLQKSPWFRAVQQACVHCSPQTTRVEAPARNGPPSRAVNQMNSDFGYLCAATVAMASASSASV